MLYWQANEKEITYGVDDLLTTRQLQDLLQVDRITIYRMLNDGRLQGFKVGGQWRFSSREIEQWLQQQRADLEVHETSSPTPDDTLSSSHVLPLACVQAIQDVYAEALDIAAVTIDLDGTPLTGVSNSNDFCNLILSTVEGRRRCVASWREVGNGQARVCHAGLLCASAPIQVNGQPVAITAACQLAGEDWQAGLPALAAGLDLDAGELGAAAGSVRTAPGDHLSRVTRLLQRVTDTFSEIGQERLNLLSRLRHIAEVSKI